MDSGPRSCAFCTKSFPSTDQWISHYNSQHSTEYRAPIFGHQTCKNCYKFIHTELWSTHSCRKSASKTRTDPPPTMPLDPPASDDPATMSVDLEMYLIPRNEPVVRVLTASSTPRVSSIAGAPGDRNHGRSSLTSDGHHRGDPLEALEAGTHSPGSPGRPPGASGDARGNRPSKPTAAGPSAGSSASATRSLRSASATVSSSTAEGHEKEGSGPPSAGRDGGSQPPPLVGEVSSRSAPYPGKN